MSPTNVTHRRWALASVYLVPLIVILDGLTKAIMQHWLGPTANNHRWEFIGRALAFEYVENRGAAFGMFDDGTLLLALASIVVITGGCIAWWRSLRSGAFLPVAIALAIGGAIGNLIDRVVRGYVIDFVSVGTWPKFNIADSAVTIGIMLLAWAMIREERKHAVGPE